MADKTILVLAASTYQAPVIRKARELGLRVITSDNMPSNPGHRLADRAYDIDITDRDGVLDMARRERIDGVIAPATDVGVETAAYVAAALGLPGVPVESAQILTTKARFREFLQRRGLPCPLFTLVDDARSHAGDAPMGKGPWIVKPNRSSGSKGIVMIDNMSAIQDHLSNAKRFSIDRKAIIEQYLAGTQHTCEGLLQDGRIVFSVVTDRRTVPRPHVATAGHFVPSRLPERRQRDLLEQLSVLFDSLELRSGPFDCDFVSTAKGIYLLEATARLGGNLLSALVHEACGLDIIQAAILHACGEGVCVAEAKPPKPAAVLILGVATGGRLWFDQHQVIALRQEPWMRYLALDYSVGARVNAFVNGRERVGEACFIGRDREDLESRAVEIENRLGLSAKAEG